MSLQRVAQLAGVSTSTVSRVVHDHPAVAAGTATMVREAMQRLSFTPTARARRNSREAGGLGLDTRRPAHLGFVVLGTSGANAAPAFETLLRGVSAACNENALSLNIGFVTDPACVPQWLLGRAVDGLLLHGDQPVGLMQEHLRTVPAVWLMANRRRPLWGDQVMPNNAVIGDMACSQKPSETRA